VTWGQALQRKLQSDMGAGSTEEAAE
jgi:hypothetical protein